MNYYEHHIGDYDQATAHLTACEDGIYSRMIRWYMASEQPLPADIAAIQRRVRAHTKDEKAAVETILAEFFELQPDGYHQHRCDAEVARFQDKQRKAKGSAEARWSKVKAQSERSADAPPNAPPNADADDMRTHSERNANGMHRAPVPSPQTPNNPPIAPQGGTRQGSPPVTFKAWHDAVKAAGEKPIPADDPVLAYAAKVGLPHDLLVLAWHQFRHRYTTDRKAKRYRDWRQVFRNAVEDNWLKLWFLAPDGTFALTTVGHQAQRARDAAEADAQAAA